MRILAISPRIPAESKKGDQVLSFHRLSHLARNHQIRLICFGHTEDDIAEKHRLESLGIFVQLIRWRPIDAAINILHSLVDGRTPFQCAFFESTMFGNAVLNAFADFQPDAVYAVTIRALGNIVGYNGPLFVDMVDSMALNFARRVDQSKGVKRFALNAEYKRVSAHEKILAQKANASFVVSSIDQKIIGCDRVRAIPLGIDVQQFYKKRNGNNDAVVVFTGNMNYTPNVNAVLWFYRNCWAKLQKVIPDVRFVVAGSNPTPEIIALRSDNKVTVTGRVPSLAVILNGSRVSIAPMQSGSGMQFKILEAMACGVPVVASSLGLGDIAAVDGKDILVADTPGSFTDAVISLLQSNALREKIGDAGVRYVKQNHSWDALNERFEQIIISCLR